MTLRESVFACLLAVAFGLITRGVWEMYRPAGWVVAGLLIAVFGWLTLGEPE